MKKEFLLILVLLLSSPAAAENIHHWVDESGEHHFTDSRPPADVESETISTYEDRGSDRSDLIEVDIYRDFDYVGESWPFEMGTGQTRAAGMFTNPQEKLTSEPRYASGEVLYGYLNLGNSRDSRITFALDGMGTTAWQLYMDRNNNEDLTDDGPPLTNQGSGKFAVLATVDVDIVTLDKETLRQPYKVWLWINRDRENNLVPLFYARCHYRGRIFLYGTYYDAVAFEREGHDGLFRDDGLCVDFDSDGKCSLAEMIHDGGTIRLGDESIKVRLLYP